MRRKGVLEIVIAFLSGSQGLARPRTVTTAPELSVK